MIVKLILICLSNLFFNFFIKMKNKKRTVLCFPFSYENEKRMKLFKNSKKKSIKHGNGSHLFEFCLSYWNKSKTEVQDFWISFFNLSKTQNGTLGTRVWLHIWQHNYFSYFSEFFFQIIFILSNYFFYLFRLCTVISFF